MVAHQLFSGIGRRRMLLAGLGVFTAIPVVMVAVAASAVLLPAHRDTADLS